MKNHIFSAFLSAFLILLIAFSAGISAFAVDTDGDGIEDEPNQVETVAPEEPAQPDTEYVEPKTEPITEYVEPETEKPTEYAQPQTDAEQENDNIEKETQQINNISNENPDNKEPTTEFVAPTLPKTVSTKNYSTNKVAGISAWGCVIIGILVLFVVLVSTSVSGFKEKRRRNQHGYYEHG